MHDSIEIEPKPPKVKKLSGPEAKILRQFVRLCSYLAVFMLFMQVLAITGQRALLPWPFLRWTQIFANVLAVFGLAAIAIFVFRNTGR
jgi:hypothetical protein